jgi:hypothetical protein
MNRFFASIFTILDLFIILILGFVTFMFARGRLILPSLIKGVILILFIYFIYQDFNSILTVEFTDFQLLRWMGIIYIIGPLLMVGLFITIMIALSK